MPNLRSDGKPKSRTDGMDESRPQAVQAGAKARALTRPAGSDHNPHHRITLDRKGEQIPAHTEWVGAPAEPAAPEQIVAKAVA